MWIPCYLFARWGWPGHKDPVGVADTFASIFLFPVLTCCAILAVSQTYQTVDLRWSGTTVPGHLFFYGFTARMMLHTPMQFVVKMPKQQLVLMTIHHIVSTVCFGAAIVTGRMQFFGCFSGCCEMSTIFLTNLCLFRDVTFKGKELRDCLPRWIYALNGVLLWLTFLVFRLMLFPLWLYIWYWDVVDFPALTWDRSTDVERYLYPAVILLLLGLSTFWFFPLTKGLLKAVGAIGGNSRGRGEKQPKAD